MFLGDLLYVNDLISVFDVSIEECLLDIYFEKKNNSDLKKKVKSVV